jgi:hypothetical protein
VNRPTDKIHLDELLDAALAGTFPASDPVSGLMHDRTKPPSENAPLEGDVHLQPVKVNVPSG